MQGVGQAGTEPFHRQLPIADLGPLVVGHHPDVWSDAIEQTCPLAGAQ